MKNLIYVCAVCMAVLVVPSHSRLIYESGFENNGEVPPDWTIESYGPGPDWHVGGQPGDWQMRVRYGAGEQDEWLISPVLDLSQDEGIRISFWQIFRTAGEGVAQVRVSLDGGETWETLVEYDSDHSDVPVIQVPQADGESQVRFCWRYLAFFDLQWDVDDVQVFSEVPVDMALLGSRGPSPGDYILRGRDLLVRLALFNAGAEQAPNSTLHFSTSAGSFDAPLLGGLAPEESISVSFTIPGDLFPSPGTDALRIVLETEGDDVANNDTLLIESLTVIDDYANPSPVLVNFDDEGDSTLFADILTQRGIAADFWHRGSGAQGLNLYGIDVWEIVVFCENQIYPSQAEQYTLMRYLDSATGQTKRGLIIGGDEFIRYYSLGVVTAEFVEDYLRLTGGTEYPDQSPSLFPLPGNELIVDQILSTDGTRFDILEPHPENPGASIALSYDEAHSSGAVATIQTTSYSAVVLGLKWSQLPVSQEQITLAGGSLDWLLANHVVFETGNVVPTFRVGPNPADDVIMLTMPRTDEAYVLKLVDLAGHVVGRWETLEERVVRLELPRSIRSGVYCLMGEGSTSRRAERVVICR